MPGLVFTVCHFDALPSTQRYLLDLLKHDSVKEGTVIVTANQTGGTGQEGTHWESEIGKNLTFSILLKPRFLEPSQQFRLTKMISLALLEFLKTVTRNQVSLAIKWPNDLYAGSRKIGGILISNAIMGNCLEHAVIGIGLNVNQKQFRDAGTNPTSLALETNSLFDLGLLLESCLDAVKKYYKFLETKASYLDRQYLENMYQYQQWSEYQVNHQTITGKITGVNEYGRLLLDTAGERLECDLKEIVYL